MTDDPVKLVSDSPWRRMVVVVATLVLAAAVYVLVPVGVNELARRTLVIFIIAAVFWATEVLPLYATSLLVIALQIVLLAGRGGLAEWLPAISQFPASRDNPAQPLRLHFGQFLQSLGNPIIVLFFGGFVLSAAITRHGLATWIASRTLSRFTARPMALLFAVLAISAGLSMWISNTAAAVMMLAIMAPLLNAVPREHRFGRALVLAVPFGANIGGMGTPIGSPPNAIALGALRNAGYDVSFIQWMVFAVPLVVVMLLITGGMLYAFYRPHHDLTLASLRSDDRMTFGGKRTLVVLCAAVALWLTGQWHGLDDAVIALLAAAALAVMQLVRREDINALDWDVLLLMWGGLSLGDAMRDTGLVQYAVNLPILDSIRAMPAPMNELSMALFVVLLAMILSTFMSNTATAALIVPVAMGLSPADQGELAILTALACSLAMAMPVSTPPNVVAFATNRFPVSAMLVTGGIITLVGIVAMMLGYTIVLPILLPW